MIGYRLGQVWVFWCGQNERTLDLQGFLWWSQQDSNPTRGVNTNKSCIIWDNISTKNDN